MGAGSANIILGVEDCSADDRDSVVGGTMVSTHFHMELADGTVEGDVSVLLIHVMDACAGLVAENDAIGFNMIGSAVKDLVDGKNLPLSRLSLELSAEVVPELGFSDDIIAGEEPDGIDLRRWVGICGELAPHHKELPGLGKG